MLKLLKFKAGVVNNACIDLNQMNVLSMQSEIVFKILVVVVPQ